MFRSPKSLRFDKINSVFGLVRCALARVEFEFHGTLLTYFEQGIDSIGKQTRWRDTEYQATGTTVAIAI
jgi:hypothetical protein